MLFLFLVAILFIALIVCIIFSAKYWHWMHITALLLVAIMAIPACYYGFAVAKVRTETLADANKQKKAAAEEEKKYHDTLYGTSLGPDGGFGEGSLKQLSVKLQQMKLNLGRVWNNCVASNSGEEGFTLYFPSPKVPANAVAVDAGDDDEKKPADDGKLAPGQLPTEGSIVYLYENISAEAQSEDGEQVQIELPGKFLGTAVVKSVEDQSVEFEKLVTLGQISDEDVLKVFDKPSTDFHGIMAKALKLDPEKLPSIEEFREKFQTQFPADSFGLTDDSEVYKKLLDEFSFDRRTIQDINAFLVKSGRQEMTPDPQNVVVEMKVINDIEISVNGDTSVYEGFLFSANGGVNIEFLKTEGKVVIPASKEGAPTTIFVPLKLAETGYKKADGETVESLEEQGKATPLNQYYYRTLKDYPGSIIQAEREIAALKSLVQVVERNNQKNLDAEQYARETSQKLESLFSARTKDLLALKEDVAEGERYEKEMVAKIQSVRKKIRDNYLRMKYISDETHRLNEKWSKEKSKVESSFN